MTLRRLLFIYLIFGIVITGFAASGLIYMTDTMDEHARTLKHSVESISVAEDAEIQLFLASRYWNIYLAGGEEGYRARSAIHTNEVNRRLATALDIADDDDEERLLIARARERVARYHEAAQQARLREVPLGGAVVELIPVFDAAVAALDEIIRVNLDSARLAHARSDSANRLADFVGIAVIAILVIGTLGLYLLFVVFVYKPLRAVHASIGWMFEPSAAVVLPPVGGAEEIRLVSLALHQAAERLRSSRERQVGFLAGVAHDLRNPLAAISAHVELLIRKQSDDSPFLAPLRLILSQTGAVNRMVDDFLDASRIEAGNFELRREPLDLGAAVREAVAAHAPLSPRHEVSVVLADEPVRVSADPLRVAQVLNNLLSNAVKYSAEGSKVRITVARRGSEALLEVSDKGVGIQADDLAHIFEPFRRTPYSRASQPGVGLGLSVVKKIVESHGGRIEVESRLGAGSTFRVFLPAMTMA